MNFVSKLGGMYQNLEQRNIPKTTQTTGHEVKWKWRTENLDLIRKILFFLFIVFMATFMPIVVLRVLGYSACEIKVRTKTIILRKKPLESPQWRTSDFLFF